LNIDPRITSEKSKFNEGAVRVLADLDETVFRTKYALPGHWKDGRKTYPLTAICVLGASNDLVEKIYKIFPGAVNQAVRKARRFSLDVVTFLVESQPLSLTKCSDNGRIPLHSTARDQSSSIDLIHYLVNRNPATISIKSQMGNTSLHLACENKLELDKVRLFIDKHDTILRETNNNGFTPLHMACNYDAPFNVIQFLLEKWPGAAKVIDNTGRTPLALYCKKDHRTIETIQLLLCANPSAIETKDARDQLPLELRQWAELICNSTFADYRYGPASKRPRIVTG
jgi:ankyrin repeat protein